MMTDKEIVSLLRRQQEEIKRLFSTVQDLKNDVYRLEEEVFFDDE